MKPTTQQQPRGSTSSPAQTRPTEAGVKRPTEAAVKRPTVAAIKGETKPPEPRPTASQIKDDAGAKRESTKLADARQSISKQNDAKLKDIKQKGSSSRQSDGIEPRQSQALEKEQGGVEGEGAVGAGEMGREGGEGVFLTEVGEGEVKEPQEDPDYLAALVVEESLIHQIQTE